MIPMLSKEDFAALVGKIAPALGDQWRVEPTDYGHNQVIGNSLTGFALYLNPGRERGRIFIGCAKFPKGPDGQDAIPHGTARPHITVANGRPAEAIAADIKRRLLPEYLEVWLKAEERANSFNQHRQGVQALAARLASLIGATVSTNDPDRPRITSYHGNNCSSYDVEINAPDSVSITIRSMSIIKAEAIITILSETDHATLSHMTA